MPHLPVEKFSSGAFWRIFDGLQTARIAVICCTNSPSAHSFQKRDPLCNPFFLTGSERDDFPTT